MASLSPGPRSTRRYRFFTLYLHLSYHPVQDLLQRSAFGSGEKAIGMKVKTSQPRPSFQRSILVLQDSHAVDTSIQLDPLISESLFVVTHGHGLARRQRTTSTALWMPHTQYIINQRRGSSSLSMASAPPVHASLTPALRASRLEKHSDLRPSATNQGAESLCQLRAVHTSRSDLQRYYKLRKLCDTSKDAVNCQH